MSADMTDMNGTAEQFAELGLEGCARCGGTHERLVWKRFETPIEDDDGTVWHRWAKCPTTGDPILFTANYRGKRP